MGRPSYPIKASVIVTEQPVLLEKEKRRLNKRVLVRTIIGIAVSIAVLITVFVPVTLTLLRRNKTTYRHILTPGLTVIVPLYIYPRANAWNPLYTAVRRRRDLNFLVVINPNNGPGDSDLPDPGYTTELKKLNAYSNVRTIGYIPIGRAQRNITDVLADVTKYAGWGQNSTALAMSGIFVDEAPADYTEEATAYLEQVNNATKDKVGHGLTGNGTIVHNPGNIPDSRLRVAQTDVQVIVENTYAGYEVDTMQAALRTVQGTPKDFCFMVHSVPDSTGMNGLVAQISQQADYIFITNLDSNYYEQFGATWLQFVDAMPHRS